MWVAPTMKRRGGCGKASTKTRPASPRHGRSSTAAPPSRSRRRAASGERPVQRRDRRSRAQLPSASTASLRPSRASGANPTHRAAGRCRSSASRTACQASVGANGSIRTSMEPPQASPTSKPGFVGGAVVDQRGPAVVEHPQRALEDVALDAAAAHGAGHLPAAGHAESRAGRPRGRAAQPHDGREGDLFGLSLPPVEVGEDLSHGGCRGDCGFRFFGGGNGRFPTRYQMSPTAARRRTRCDGRSAAGSLRSVLSGLPAAGGGLSDGPGSRIGRPSKKATAWRSRARSTGTSPAER